MNLYLSSVSKLQIIDQKEITLSKAMIKGQNVKYLLMPNDVTQYVKERRRTPKPDKERSSDYGHRGRGGGYQARGGGHQMRGRGGYNEQRRGRGGYNKNGNHYQNRSNQDN
ncbi:hypothetical protein GPJ56_009255 [Histomonas meleagridis]|uniref:uncharacterized protein n=1 Tax=Histomonas meleagridis TaxID=135588 RepID=UPI00355A5941|nr:hypothetical protein GPJ56_009255 [Histomonas meleagridis]KAH0801626.1 hypothetical protein GO595_005625 [Histomonas meleagridis]